MLRRPSGLANLWKQSSASLVLAAVWVVLSASVNLRYPGPELEYWYILPSVDITVLLLTFALMGLRGWRMPARGLWFLSGLLVFIRLLRIGDGVRTRYFSTTFSLYMDTRLLPELVRLYYSTESHLKFTLTCVGVIMGLLVLIWATHLCVKLASSTLTDHRAIQLFLGAVGLLILVSPLANRNQMQLGIFGKSAVPRLIEEAKFLVLGSSYRAAVLDNIAQVDTKVRTHPNNLAKLDGSNVYLFIIESYGQTLIDRPVYNAQATEIYALFESGLQPLGFHIASDLLDSSTYGGSSWLAHATLGTGILTDNQFKYRTVSESKPLTLAAVFHAAGYRTILAQPATTRPWPEGDFYRFDQQYYAWNFKYQGPRYSWAPMPDQYVIDFIRRKELTETRHRLFLQYALVSSHAPWNQQPPMIYNESNLVDGKIYNKRRARTFPTDWSDMTHAGDAYVHSIQYDLEVLRRYIAKYIHDDSLIIILGDHQPNGDITANSPARGVPIHVISRKQALVDAFLSQGYVSGMRPDLKRPHLEMADFFPTLVQEFSAPS
jgi:hypothetical protein